MKTITPRLCALIGALLLSCGLARAAEHFDLIAGEMCESPDASASCAAPPCVEPPDRSV